ncbi:hypothetical protein, partial [Pseudomonas sp. FW305-47B]|uniref:hypothetical protein n=1 Tax=Pseudomonas sp. FW305-47B TaxID=2070558 RepID=UPI001C44E212
IRNIKGFSPEAVSLVEQRTDRITSAETLHASSSTANKRGLLRSRSNESCACDPAFGLANPDIFSTHRVEMPITDQSLGPKSFRV